ncbi:MAG TPA: outer membrane beta-barrel protein [Kiritimatiellia bacterium]|jgi:hypothetical protein
MKWLKHGAIALSSFAMVALSAQAADETRSFQVNNRLRVEYDDNVYERETDKTESFKVIEELEFLVNLNLPQTYIGLRYRPSFVWWDDREPDSEDWYHDFDLVLSHNVSDRLSLSAKDTLRFGEQPQAIDRGSIIRENNDFLYNVADGKVNYLLNRKSRLEVGYRNTLLRYDDDEVAETEDFDINAAGATLRHQWKASTVLAADYRFETIEYEGPDRGSDSHYVGGGVEQTFSPSFLANARAGYQLKQFNADDIDDGNDPYFDASLTYLPSPRTRITGGAAYSMLEADVFPFANQDRSIIFLSLAHDLTAKVSLYASGSFQLSEYNAEEQVGDDIFEDGDEQTTQFGTRASYKITRNNSVEIGWQFLDLQSEFREEFDRNRVDVGWRVKI